MEDLAHLGLSYQEVLSCLGGPSNQRDPSYQGDLSCQVDPSCRGNLSCQGDLSYQGDPYFPQVVPYCHQMVLSNQCLSFQEVLLKEVLILAVQCHRVQEVLHYWDHLQRALHSSKVLAEELHLVVLVWQFHFADAVYPVQ